MPAVPAMRKGYMTIDSNLEWVRLAQRVPVRIRPDEQQGNLDTCRYDGNRRDHRC